MSFSCQRLGRIGPKLGINTIIQIVQVVTLIIRSPPIFSSILATIMINLMKISCWSGFMKFTDLCIESVALQFYLFNWLENWGSFLVIHSTEWRFQEIKILNLILGYVWFQKVQRKEKNTKKNDFLMFGCPMKNIKEN